MYMLKHNADSLFNISKFLPTVELNQSQIKL